MAAVESLGITDVGQKRKGNEDSFFLDEGLGLYVVADGMGGHQAGEVASKIVVDTIRDYMKRFAVDDEAEELEDFDDTLSKEANRLLSSIHLANKGVYQLAQSNEDYKGMGSTVSAALITEDTLIAANVGDSPIYLIHDGNIELLSVTHNVISEQLAINPKAAEALGDGVKYLLTRGMGIEETVQPDVCEVQFFKGDVVVISSDGLSDLVTPEEILDVVKKEPTAKACQTLVDMANARGGHDNITVIVFKVKDVKNKGGIFSGVAKKLISLLQKFA